MKRIINKIKKEINQNENKMHKINKRKKKKNNEWKKNKKKTILKLMCLKKKILKRSRKLMIIKNLQKKFSLLVIKVLLDFFRNN